MAGIEIRGVRKAFGPQAVIHGMDLTVESGEFMVLVGPSGCGKSTLLRMVAGLEDPTEGTIAIGGKVVNNLSPKAREVAMVFQNYALYPHMTVKENMAFSLRLSHVPKTEIEERVRETAEILGMGDFLHKKPGHLSGGQKQRVAMGRAMVRQPKVFLFDEPLSNLDAQLRVKMRSEISLLHRRLKATVLYVTHDQVEAMTLADRIAVIYQGRLEQVGPPLQVYHEPRTRFVASFIGTPPMNFLPIEATRTSSLPAGTSVFGFRPEVTRLGPAVSGEKNLGKGKVMLVEPLGMTAHVHIKLESQSIVAEVRATEAPQLDSEIEVFVPENELFFFGKDGACLGAGAAT